jgi:hypothetical protein
VPKEKKRFYNTDTQAAGTLLLLLLYLMLMYKLNLKQELLMDLMVPILYTMLLMDLMVAMLYRILLLDLMVAMLYTLRPRY